MVRVAASEYVKQRAERGRREEPRADTERRCYCPGTAARQFKTESVTQRATRTFDFDAPVTRQKPCVGPGPVPAPDASPASIVRGRLARIVPVWLTIWTVTSTSFSLTFVAVQTSLFIPNAPRAGVVTGVAATALLDIASANVRTRPRETFR
jgi:hypothetical protein